MTLTLSTTLVSYISFNSKIKIRVREWTKIINHKEINNYPPVMAYVADSYKSDNALKALHLLEKQRDNLNPDSIYYPIYTKKIKLLKDMLKKERANALSK